MSNLIYPYGFIYETTNKINGMKYIGSHTRLQSEDDPDDSWYLGSGIYFSNALQFYGKENFTRVILEDVNSEDELIEKEEYYLNLYDCANNPMYYNLINSAYRRGISGYVFSNESRKKLSESLTGRLFSEEHKMHLSSSMKGRKLTSEHVKHMSDSLRGRTLPDRVKNKISETLRNPDHNPMSNPESRKKVADSKLNKIWVNNGETQTYVDQEDLGRYLSAGYSKGMLKRKGNTNKGYNCHCKVCGIYYKGGKYSTMCKKCYSDLKRSERLHMIGGNDNE